MDFLQACRKLISFDSTPSQGTFPMVSWLKEYCESKKLHVEVHEENFSEQKQANILIRPYLPTVDFQNNLRPPVEFLFLTHLDTRDPGSFNLWEKTSYNPFEAHIQDERIYGLGAADSKLDFLCKIAALDKLGSQKKWTLPPVVVGTFGEETGMTGALKLIRKNKVNPKYALIGEPTDLKLSHASKGFAAIEIHVPFSEEELRYRDLHDLKESTSTQSRIFHGVEGHGAHPELGESAITKLFQYISQLPEGCALMELDGGTNYNTIPAHAFLELDLVSLAGPTVLHKINALYKTIQEIQKDFENHIDDEFMPNRPTLNVGFIKTYKNYIQILATCRIPSSIQQETLDFWLNQIRECCKKELCHFQINDFKKPFRTPEHSMLLKSCKDELTSLNLEPALITLASTNEASLFSRLGVECVCFGPGEREDNLHTPKESVSLEQLNQATEFYTQIMKRLCL